LVVIWEASDRVCGKRLRPFVPILVEAMERHGHLRLDSDVRNGLLSMSAATIDRVLRWSGGNGTKAASAIATLGSDQAERCGANCFLKVGMIRRLVYWKAIWWRIAGQRKGAVLYKR